jgi:hypothetical protein
VVVLGEDRAEGEELEGRGCGKRSGAQGRMWGAESLNGARPFDVLPDRRIRTPAQMARHLGNRKPFAGYGFVNFPRPLPFSFFENVEI